MSGFDSKKTEYMLLHMIADSGHPIGAGFLADMLTSEGEEAASEATIGRYLRKLEKQGLLRSEKYNGRSRGRVITEDGARRIRELEIEHRQEKAMQDTMEIFNNGFGGHLRNLLRAISEWSRRQRPWPLRTHVKKTLRRCGEL